MKTTRASEVALKLGTALALWAAVLFGADLGDDVRFVVTAMPLWALVALGAYCLGRLGLDVLTFPEAPDAGDELAEQIKEARADLKRKGLKF